MPKPDITRYTHATFWTRFVADILAATMFVVIHSAYLTRLRASMLRKYFLAAIARGVKIYIIMQDRDAWKKPGQEIELKEFEQVLKLLEEWGIPYELRPDVHQKICIIDGEIVWEGSLNMMSHRESAEQVLRHRSKQSAYWMQNTHNLFPPTSDGKSAKRLALRRRLGFFLRTQRSTIPGLTQAKLGALVNLKQAEVCRIERGERSISLKTLRLMTKHLEFTIRVREKNRSVDLPAGKDGGRASIPFMEKRSTAGLSQRQMALASDCNRHELSTVEKNLEAADVDVIMAVGEILGVELKLHPQISGAPLKR